MEVSLCAREGTRGGRRGRDLLPSGAGPLVQVSPEHGAAIAELSATLGFDIYALPEDQPYDEAAMRPLTRNELSDLNARLASEA